MSTDVCVVGGGPAGAALAIRLRALGRSVTVIERAVPPRPHVGESVSPGAWPVLEALGVRDLVEAERFPRARRALVRWEGATRLRRAEEDAAGVTVDRGRFDALLLERARAAGAAVLTGVAAERPVRDGDGWRVPLRGGGAPVACRFVADASGRARLLGGRRGGAGPRTVALHALWSDGGDETRIEALPEGWLWGAPLPDATFRAMAFLDASLVRDRGGRSAMSGLYAELLGRSSLFRALGAPVGPVAACDATCSAAETPIDERSVRVGEAAYAIDPLSSSGVHAALQSGLAAAVAIHTLLTPGADHPAAISFYRDHQRHAVERHAALAPASYAERGGDEPFWRARAAPPEDRPEPLPVGLMRLESLLPHPVRLAPPAALAPTPCVVDDRVELRRALTHPALPRPVAFLGGHELAPLIDAAVASPTLGDAIASRRVEPPVARWLAERALLEPAGRPAACVR